ncbi:glycosyltransferase [bacterium]|nr:glycosyltransferase [bacterium]
MPQQSNPDVSIIIPCYQQESYISDAINSALNQSHSAVEVIVVNDGSTDSSGKIAQSFGDRIKYIEKENEGVSKTRNRGVSESRGEYLIFLDGDDLLAQRAVEFHLTGMQEKEHRITLLGHSEFTTTPTSVPDSSPPKFHYEDALPKLIYSNYGPPAKFMCSRQNFTNVGGYGLKTWGCEDWNLWTKIAFDGVDVARSETVGMYYRRGEEMRTSNHHAMLTSQCEHYQQIHNLVIQNTIHLSHWGEELLKAEERALRFLIANKMPRNAIQQIGRQMRSLNELGIYNTDAKRLKAFLNRVLGSPTTQRLTLLKWAITDRQHLRRCRDIY